MRTTLTIDDDLAALLRQRSRTEERPFKEVVNEALRAGLARLHRVPAPRERFLVVPFQGGRSRLPQVTSAGELLSLIDEHEAPRK